MKLFTVRKALSSLSHLTLLWSYEVHRKMLFISIIEFFCFWFVFKEQFIEF